MSKNKIGLKTILQNNWHYAAAFFIPAGVLFLAYLFFGVYPGLGFLNSEWLEPVRAMIVGPQQIETGNSVLSLDLNAQYVYYFDYIYDVFSGKESLFYSWSRNLSGEFLGIIGYYLASPFSFIVWAFPREHITEGLLCMILAKVGSIGVTAAVYLYRGRGFRKSTSVIFSMMYSLCSYVLVQTMNPMWLDGVIALPLVIYGIEQLIRKGRFRMLAVSLIYSFVTCFYIGYMIGIFACVYFCFNFWISRAYDRLRAGQVFARIGLFMVSGASAVLSSCFMLVPVINSLNMGKFTFSDPDYSAVGNFTLFDLFGKLLPNSYDTVRMEGLPFFYCGLLTLIMAICYFFLKKVTVRSRISNAFLILILMLCMFVRPTDMLWHGGQMPNWLPYRYSFIVSFLLIVCGAEAFENIKYFAKKQIAVAGAVVFGMIILLGKFDSYSESLERDLLPELTTIATAAVITAIFTAYIIQTKDKQGIKKAAAVTLAILVGGELFYNTITGLVSQDNDIVYSNRESYVEPIGYLREKMDEIYEHDDGFFRVEKNFNRSANDPMALRMYGLTHSSSTLNERPISLIGELGMTSRGHYTKYTGATPMIDDLFGIKYILSCPDNEYGRITGKEDISVEQNTDAMPIAYLTDPITLDYFFDDYPADRDNVFAKQNRLMSHILGKTDSSDYIKTIPEEDLFLETENVNESKASGHIAYKVVQNGRNSQLKYTLIAPEEGEIFLWMPSDYERKLNVWINGDVWKGNYYETENYNAKSLGVFEKFEEFTVTLTLTGEDLYFKDIMFGYFDKELYADDYGLLRDMNENTSVTKISPTRFAVETNYPEERLLLTTVPIERGWNIKVDGREVKPATVLDALMGVELSGGAHRIEFEYNVPDRDIILWLTATGLMIFALMCVFSYRFKKRYGEVDYGLPLDVSNMLFTKDDGEAGFGEIDASSQNKINDILSDLIQINEIEPPEEFEEENPKEKEENLTDETIKLDEPLRKNPSPAAVERENESERAAELLNPAEETSVTPPKIIPYKEVSKHEQYRLMDFDASAEDFFPQTEVDKINKSKRGK
ncbi:MAG: YfhO family protein [Eubacterium sp.]|jgi:uncharacterized membrane protein YfhO|nr:YfhO family protein [Eubacterium sp.]